MTKHLTLKPASEIFLKVKSSPKKGKGKGGRRDILNFPFIQVFYLVWTPTWKSSEKQFLKRNVFDSALVRVALLKIMRTDFKLSAYICLYHTKHFQSAF